MTAGALLILTVDPSGGYIRSHIDRDERTSLTALQTAVGGYLEAAHLTDRDMTAYVNEDGSALNLAPNPIGTRVLRALGWRGWALGGTVLGPVVFTGQRGPATVGLTEDQAARLVALVCE